jgi:hypothetical protein
MAVAELVKKFPAFCETRRFIAPKSSTALCCIHTILPLNPTLQELNPFPSLTSSTALCCIHTILPLNPYSEGTESISLPNILHSVMLYSHDPATEPLLWRNWIHFPPSHPPQRYVQEPHGQQSAVSPAPLMTRTYLLHTGHTNQFHSNEQTPTGCSVL